MKIFIFLSIILVLVICIFYPMVVWHRDISNIIKDIKVKK